MWLLSLPNNMHMYRELMATELAQVAALFAKLRHGDAVSLNSEVANGMRDPSTSHCCRKELKLDRSVFNLVV